MIQIVRLVAILNLLGLLTAAPAVTYAQPDDESSAQDEEADDEAPGAGNDAEPGATPDPKAEILRRRMQQIDRFRGLRGGQQLRPAGGVRGAQPSGGSGDTSTPTPHTVRTPIPHDTPEPGGGGDAEPTPTRRRNDSDCKPMPDSAKFYLDLDKPETDLEAVIEQISKITCKNFIYDKKDIRNQKIVIITKTKVTVPEAYQAFVSALESNGLTIIKVGPNLYKVVPRREAIQRPLDTRAGERLPWTEEFVTRIIQLDNISVQDVQQVVSTLVAKDGNATPFAPTNSFIITDTAVNIRRIVKIISELDRAGADLQIKIIQLENADASSVAQIIEQLFGGDNNNNQPQVGGAAARARALRRAAAAKTATPSSGESGLAVSKVIPVERSNQLIIQASKSAFPAIQDVIDEIDKPLTEDLGTGIYVYYLENGDAEEMATVLSNLAAGAGNQNANRAGFNRGAAVNRPGGINAGGDANGPAVADLLQGDVKITADKATNSLVIVADRSDYNVLRGVIQKLDIRRRQVFVEAVIADITLGKTSDLGVSWAAGGLLADGVPIFGGLNAGDVLLLNPANLASGGLLGIIGPQKIPFNVTDPTTGEQAQVLLPPFGVLLSALETDSNTNVLSRPTVLATENEEAEFISATSVAFQGSSTISTTGLQNFAITKEDVGITLRVTPKITESEYVTLQIFQEVKSIAKDQLLANGQRLIDTQKRSAKTTVVAKNGQTVVLGGLISDEDIDRETKIPLLGDIPFLGWLFRTKGNTSTKSNLVIFLTPNIIRDEEDMQEVYQRKIEERELFMKYYANRADRKEDERKLTMFDRYFGVPDEKKKSDVQEPEKLPAPPPEEKIELPKGPEPEKPEEIPTDPAQPMFPDGDTHTEPDDGDSGPSDADAGKSDESTGDQPTEGEQSP